LHERKNAASMGPTEISKFMNALLELKKKPAVTASGTPTNVYDQFVAIHDAAFFLSCKLSYLHFPYQ